MHEIKKNTKGVSLEARKLLSNEVILRLSKAAQKAIYVNAHGDVSNLKTDLRNSVFHVFGNHRDCKQNLCDSVGETKNDKTELLKSYGLHHHVYAALNLLVTKAPLLISNETNNLAEQYMNILARFNMGKRLNLVQRDGFETRSYLTGLRYNKGASWHTMTWKKCFERSPGKNLRRFVESAVKRCAKRKSEVTHKARKRLKFNPEKKSVVEYGPNIAELEMSQAELQEEVNNLVERLKVKFNLLLT